VLALLNPTSLVASSGYAAVFLLSVLQSCCVPTSSELTLGFAGVLAAEGRLSLPGAIVAGVAGELVGAFVAWAVGRTAGRAVVDRWGKYLLLSHHDLDRAEAWYDRHPRWGVFGSRLLPVIRNFVALPAGIAEVPPARFVVLTLLGSLVWNSAMALIGYGVGNRWRTVMKGFNDAGYLLGALVVVAIVVFIWHRYRSYRAHTAADSAPRQRGQHLAGRSGAAPRGSRRAQPGPSLAEDPAGLPARPTVAYRPPATVRILPSDSGLGRRDGESSAAPPS
jgi:membrane protein DedA with SNARE-associated domain